MYSGVVSFTNDEDSPLPQTNCSLAATIQQNAELPLSLLLLITGFVLIFIDIGITALLCIMKWKNCGVLTIAWFLVVSVCSATWTFLSIFYLAVVMPAWVDARDTCDYLVALMAMVCVGYCGILTVAYAVVIIVVIAYDCNRWRNIKDI